MSSAPSPCTGAIPPDLGNCTALGGFDLSGNQLTGARKFWIIFIARVAPDLHNNSVEGSLRTGSIPSELGNCTALVDLRLFNNQLEGACNLDYDLPV